MVILHYTILGKYRNIIFNYYTNNTIFLAFTNTKRNNNNKSPGKIGLLAAGDRFMWRYKM